MFAIASGSGGLGSGNHAKITLQDNFDGTTGINVDSQKIYIGQSSSARLAPSDIRIGGSARVLVSGSNGYVTQQFTAPAANNEYPQTTVVGASNGGTAYNRVFQGVMDYSNFGLPYLEDAFAIEYFDSLSYGYGSQFYLNGKSTELGVTPNGGGSSNIAKIKLQDVGNNTSNLDLRATTLSLGTNTAVTSTALGNNSNPTIIQGNSVTVTGNLHLSASVLTDVETLTISSQTSSIDFNTAQTKVLTLVSGSDTHVDFTNQGTGQTVILKVKQPATGPGTLIFAPDAKQPDGLHYSASQAADAIDVVTLQTLENDGNVFVVSAKKFN